MKPRNAAIAILLAIGVALLLWALAVPYPWSREAGPDSRHPPVVAKSGNDVEEAAVADPAVSTAPAEFMMTETASADSTEDATDTRAMQFFIEGQVLGDADAPVGDAEIRVFRYLPLLSSHELVDLFARTKRTAPSPHDSTDSNGKGLFRVELDAPGEYLVEVSASGYATVIEAPVRLTDSDPGALIFFQMQPDVHIHGRLHDARGVGIANEPVFLLEKVVGPQAFHTHRALTTANGEFTFEGLGGLSYIFMAQPRERTGVVLGSLVAPIEDLDITVPAAVDVRARVVNSRSGDPVAGARITALSAASYDQVTSDGEGYVNLFLSSDDADVVIHHDDFVVREQRIQLQSDGVIVFELTEGQRVTGRVVTETNRPVSGASVALLQRAVVLADLRATHTDTNGEFTIGPVRPGQNGAGATILVRKAGWCTPATSDTDWGDNGSIGDIVLVPSARVSGVLHGHSGRRLADAALRLIPANPESQLGRSIRWLRGDQQTFSAQDGSFRFDDVVPCAGYVLEVSHAAAADERIHLESFPDEPLILTLGEGATLSGTIVDATTKEPLSALIFAEWEGSPAVRRNVQNGTCEGGTRFTADAAGRFWIDRVPVGPVTLFVQRPPYAIRRLVVNTQSEDAEAIEVRLTVFE